LSAPLDPAAFNVHEPRTKGWPMSSPTAVARLGRGEMQSALTTLAQLRQTQPPASVSSTRATGFVPLDDVLGGGVRPGELLLVGGKPAVGKTIACLQWARTMARRGVVAVYLCFEHDRATLLARLLSCELGEAAVGSGWPLDFGIEELQGRLRDVAAGALTLREALESDPLLAEAEQRLAVYADRLLLFQGTAQTDVPAISHAMRRFEGESAALFVDYVQKVPARPATRTEAERVSCVGEALKQLALEQDLPIVAIAAAEHDGLAARRLHLHHFGGSAALAYEADKVIVLNDKVPVVSRAHLAYSPHREDEFRREVVFSVEKNRSGVANVDLEFTKDFTHYRFDPHGSWVAERLWTEGSMET
jgi:replicative DNA helicase